MEIKMKKDIVKKPLPKVGAQLFKIILFICYPLCALHSLVIAPLFTVCDSNVAVDGGVTVFLYYLMVMIDLAVFFISFAVLIYGMCYLPIKKMKKTVIIVFLSPFFKYLLKFLISPFVDGIPSLDQLAEDLYSYLISGGLEVIQYALVMLVMLKPSKKHRDGRMMGDADSVRSPLVPFSRILSLKNPLQLGALASAAVVLVGRVASLAISDLNHNYIIKGINQYLIFFAPYIIEAVVCSVGYFLMLYIFIQIYSSTADE